MVRCKVNEKLLPVKVLNFLYYAGLASYYPFKTNFQKQLGLSATQNGLIQAADKIVEIISQPASGAIADKTKSIKVVMIIWLVLGAVFVLPMVFISPVQFQNSTLELQCCNNTTKLTCLDEVRANVYCDFSSNLCRKGEVNNSCPFISKNLQIHRKNVLSLMACSENRNATKAEAIHTKTFVILFCQTLNGIRQEMYEAAFALMLSLTVASAIFLALMPALIDASILQALGKDKVGKYGLQRLWGAVGYGVLAMGVGFGTDFISNKEAGSESEKSYLFSFIAASVLFLLTAAVCIKIDIASPGATNIFFGIFSLLKQAKIILFFLMVYFSGCAIGLQVSFLFWFVVTLPGASHTILGLAIVANAVAEIPFFLIAEVVAKKTSYNFLLCFGLFCYSIRFLCYTLVKDAWQVVLIELLHGPSFAFPITALNAQADVLSPKGMVATTVGVTQAIYRGVGFSTGALLGRVAYKNCGPITTFRGMAILCFAISILYMPAVKLVECIVPEKTDANIEETYSLMETRSIQEDD